MLCSWFLFYSTDRKTKMSKHFFFFKRGIKGDDLGALWLFWALGPVSSNFPSMELLAVFIYTMQCNPWFWLAMKHCCHGNSHWWQVLWNKSPNYVSQILYVYKHCIICSLHMCRVSFDHKSVFTLAFRGRISSRIVSVIAALVYMAATFIK